MADEVSARDLLSEMQSRLGRDPQEALGLAGSPTPSDVRTAFLTLTKKFHPAKFARMAPDIQRLANEVFLSLRAAHDNLSRPSVAPTRKSGPLPILRASQPQPTISRAPTGQVPVIPRAAPLPAQTATQVTQPMRPFANPRPGQTDQRPARIAQPSPPPSPVRPGQPARPAVATTTGGDPLAPILELIKVQQIAAARVALETLTARSPNVPKYQALLHYARGREAQLAKRVDEARVELQDALQIDPELALAKTALAELFTRRK